MPSIPQTPASHGAPAAARASPAVWLVDNGSLDPAATLSLRVLAARLSEAAGVDARPVSLLHSSAVDAAALGGRPAEIFEPALRRFAEAGGREVAVVPLFIGPSGAITEYLPERVRHLQRTWPDLRVRVASCLVDAARRDDGRVAAMLADQVRAAAAQAGFARPAVAVVDHGTPARAVNAGRELVAAQVRALLGEWPRAVAACSMERRPGAEFDFNEPLLERLLDAPEFSDGEVVIAKLFLQPGRHAGLGGDVEQIALAAQARHSGLRLAFTAPLGADARMVELLAERLNQLVGEGDLTLLANAS